MNQMAGVVQASLKAGALDMKAVTEILNAAVKAGVFDQHSPWWDPLVAGAFPAAARAAKLSSRQAVLLKAGEPR